MYRTSNPSLATLSRTLSVAAALVASVLLLGACDSAGLSSEGSNVEVGFATSYAPSGSAAATDKSNHESLEIPGSNGVLEISDVRLIVSELELEGDDDGAEFEADPSFLDLPLDTTNVETLTNSQIPPGRYNEFEFEVEDVDIEENDDDEQALRDLREEVTNEFSNWPEGASMVVVGTFTPDGGTPQDFTTYFEAEIEVERDLDPALEVTGDGLSRRLTVELDPTRWFRSEGTVQDLTQNSGELTELEVEFEDGVADIEVDDEDDEDDDDDEDDSYD